MDTSTEYIQMCKESTVLQGRWQPQTGDYVSSLRCNKFEGILQPIHGGAFAAVWHQYNGKVEQGPICAPQVARRFYSWLPRVDQLQEIDKNSWQSLMERFNQFHRSVWLKKGGNPNVSDTKLWLHYVMWVRYGMVWNGRSWIQTSPARQRKAQSTVRDSKLLNHRTIPEIHWN